MPAYQDQDLTLPSVAATLPARAGEQQLRLTIVFHPDVSRIGESAPVPRLVPAAPPWVLGRCSPLFSRTGSALQAPLEDLHVSRQAVALVGEAGGRVTLQKLPSASRCRVSGRELDDTLEFAVEQLAAGVPLLLGHSVVLLLRLAPWVDDADAAPEETRALRGSSAYMAGLRRQVAQAAGSELDVLVRGATGTGKELVAAAIHECSARCAAPMVTVNMAAVPASLAAAALFGSARGAFTGAHKASDGYFSQAHGGTLFLDEIGDTPVEVQPQLLRALQQREIQAVGGTIRTVDVRVVSATDAVLEDAGCDFKAALRYRLGAFEIRLLPLREHPEDIGELLLHFLAHASEHAGRTDLLPGGQSSAREIAMWADLFYRLVSFAWPGNVRELANFASQIVVASGDELVVPDNILQALQRGRTRAVSSGVAGGGRLKQRTMRDIDDTEFERALHTGEYEVTNVARQLGVSRQSVYRRIEQSPRYRLAGQVPQAELERVLAQHAGDAHAAALALQVSPSGLRTRLRNSGLTWF